MERLTDQTQVIKAIKKIMVDDDVKAVDLAASLDLAPQGLQKVWNKKNFSFHDVKKILDALGYDLYFEIRKKD